MKSWFKLIMVFIRSIFGIKSREEKIIDKSVKHSKKRAPVKKSKEELKYNWLNKAGLTARETKKGSILFTSKRYQKAPTKAKINKPLFVDRKESKKTSYRLSVAQFSNEIMKLRDAGIKDLKKYFGDRNKFGIPVKLSPKQRELS